MNRYDLNSEFFNDLKRLNHLVLGIHEAYGIFSAIENKADDLNKLAIGRPFAYIQWLSVERMFLNFGKATSRNDKDLSFRFIRSGMDEYYIVDPSAIDKYLELAGMPVAGRNERKRFCSFRDDFDNFDDDDFKRLKSGRDRFVAHTDKVAKWTEIGAKFTDFEKFLAVCEKRIDTCFHCFFELSLPKVSLFAIGKEEPERNIRSFEKLVDQTIEAARSK